MVDNLRRDITSVEFHSYTTDGVVCLRDLFPDHWVRLLADTVERIAAQPEHMLGRPVGPGAFLGDQFVWKRIDEFRDFIYGSPAARIAQAVMNTEVVRLFYDQLFVKPSGCALSTPWHHDYTFWPIKGGPVCSIWMALSDISSSNSSLEFIRGSHRWPQRFKAARPDNLAYMLESDLEEIPDIDANRDSYDIVSWEMSPGDVLVFDPFVVHGASHNLFGRPRYALATRWCGGNTFYDPRHAVMRLHWKHDLKAGDPLAGRLFPQILPVALEHESGAREAGPEGPDPELVRETRELYEAAERRRVAAGNRSADD